MQKIPVAILGATGRVGQKFIELLLRHPWFEIVALASRFSGKKYGDHVKWVMQTPLPHKIAEMPLLPYLPQFDCDFVFSGLSATVAGEIEEEFARAGYTVISNARNHRMHPYVPLLIPEVNPEHLKLLDLQPYPKGKILTNPNCCVVGLAIALKPLVDRWGIDQVHVVTLQALSGAGLSNLDLADDNVIPFIVGEEEKIQTEPLKILGQFTHQGIKPYAMKISAQCNRVPVMDGHLACVSVKLREKASQEAILEAWQNFQTFKLPSAPKKPIIYHTNEAHPQPRLHRDIERGMATSIGRLRPCPLLDWKFTVLSHNTVRGAAGCALLNAELLFTSR